jgi:hypothetical protein
MHGKSLWIWALLGLLRCAPLRAQEVQFLPEVDAHLTLNSSWRAYLPAKHDRDAGASSQSSIGPSVWGFPLVVRKTSKHERGQL